MNGAVLLLDAGNSRLKWALTNNGEWLAEGVAAYEEIDQLIGEWNRFPAPQKVLGCNVAGEARLQVVTQYWQGRDLSVDWLRSSKTCAGVHNLYDRPEQLGTDRWAALIGAWHRVGGACLVVTAGTALTVDALNRQGEFIGGLILPGKRLMQQSLVAGTHALDALAGEVADYPRNTADAMASGIALALIASVQTAYQRLASTQESAPPCLVSGGDAEWLANQLQIGVIIAPKLIHEGLLIMAESAVQA